MPRAGLEGVCGAASVRVGSVRARPGGRPGADASARPRDDLERPEREAAERGRMGAEATVQSRPSSPNGDCPTTHTPGRENIDVPGLIPYHEVAPRLCQIAAGERPDPTGSARSVWRRPRPVPRPSPILSTETFAPIARSASCSHVTRSERNEVAERNPQLRSVMWVNGLIHGNEWRASTPLSSSSSDWRSAGGS